MNVSEMCELHNKVILDIISILKSKISGPDNLPVKVHEEMLICSCESITRMLQNKTLVQRGLKKPLLAVDVAAVKAEIRSLLVRYDVARLNGGNEAHGWFIHELRELSADE